MLFDQSDRSIDVEQNVFMQLVFTTRFIADIVHITTLDGEKSSTYNTLVYQSIEWSNRCLMFDNDDDYQHAMLMVEKGGKIFQYTLS